MYEVLYVPGTWWRRLGGAWKRTKLILCFWTYFSKRVVWTSYVSYQVPAQAPRVHFFCRVKCFCKMCSTYSYINRPPYKSVHVWSCFFFATLSFGILFFFLPFIWCATKRNTKPSSFLQALARPRLSSEGVCSLHFQQGLCFFSRFFFSWSFFFVFVFPL